MRLITAKEVADSFQMPLARVYELARQGRLPVVRFGERQIRFDEGALNEWIKIGGIVECKGGTYERK
jgi:excisionase family DNA binding protein